MLVRLAFVGLRCGFIGGGRSGSGTVRTRLTAKCLTTAMFLAPWPLRRRDWSSAKTALSTQRSWFSMRHWPRTASPACLAESGAEEM